MYKILVNGLQLSNQNSGVQYYTSNLFNELQKIESDKIEIQLLQQPVHNFQYSGGNRLKRILFENISLPNYLRKKNYILYHSPNYVLSYFLNSRSVLTIHDLITLDYPELCQPESVLYFRLLLSRSIKKADKIIAVSQTVKDDILKRFNVLENKIIVIPLGISSIFKKTIDFNILHKYQIPERYILFVGNIEPKKNLVRLIKAFHLLLKTKAFNYKLVIAGKKGWKYKPVFKLVDDLNIKEKVIFIGYVPENELPALYSMADLFVFPSLYEGFGIPPLEAMACETPVLVSNKGALPETTGGVCPQVDPYNIDSIAEEMYKVINTEKLRNESVQKGKEWVSQFCWKKAAQETMEVYKEILSF